MSISTRTARLVAALVASITAVAASPLPTTEGESPTPTVALLGELTVELPASAQGHGVVDVQIPVDASYSMALDNANFRIETSADFAAVVLVEDRRDDAQVVFAGQANPDVFCAEGFEDCRTIAGGTLVRQRRLEENAGGDPVIAAGTYRLHVVTDGPAATVHLAFPELDGAAVQVTAVDAPTSASVAMPENDAVIPAPGVHTASSERTLDGKGMAWTLFGATGDLGFAGQYGICSWAGGLPEDDLHRHPGCVTATTASRSERIEVSTESEVFMDFSITGMEPGTVGFSSYFGGAPRIATAGTVTMYLEY